MYVDVWFVYTYFYIHLYLFMCLFCGKFCAKMKYWRRRRRCST